MVLIIIGIIIILYSFVNFKKAFIWFLAYQIFASFGIQLMKLGDISIPLGTTMSLFFVFMYIAKAKYIKKRDASFPFKLAFILIVISRIMTCFTTLSSFSEEFNRAITFIFQNIINIYIAWNVFSTKEDFAYFFKLVTIVFFLSCILGYVEFFLQYNPYTNYEKDFIGEGINYYSIEHARGYRLTSVFEHPIGAGMNFALYFVITMYLVIKNGKNIPYRKLAIITALMCIPLILLTKQRSAIFFLLLMLVSLIDFKKTKFYVFLIVAIIGVFILSPMLSEYSYYITSVFDESAQEQVNGSSFSMRVMQLEGCFELLKISPLAGLGEKYNIYLSNYWLKQVLMLESVWLEQMVKHGIMGILSYLILAITFVFKIPRKYNIGKIKYILIAFWIIYTITTVPSFRMHLLYILVFYFIYSNEQNKNNKREIVI